MRLLGRGTSSSTQWLSASAYLFQFEWHEQSFGNSRSVTVADRSESSVRPGLPVVGRFGTPSNGRSIRIGLFPIHTVKSMENNSSKIVVIFLGCVMALALSAGAEQASAQTKPAAESSAGLPVQAPNGWDSVAWTRFRSYCLGVAKKVAKHNAMSISEIQTAKMCMAYGRPSSSQVGAPLPAPPSQISLQPLQTPVPEKSPQSSVGGTIQLTPSPSPAFD